MSSRDQDQAVVPFAARQRLCVQGPIVADIPGDHGPSVSGRPAEDDVIRLSAQTGFDRGQNVETALTELISELGR